MVRKLEPLQLVESVTGRAGFTSSIGVHVLSADIGRVTLELLRRSDLLQFNGFFHGGAIAGLADHAAGAAVTTELPPELIAVTVNIHVNYLAPADGDRIIARATAEQVGNTLCVATVDVTTATTAENERRCALATATLRAVDFAATQE